MTHINSSYYFYFYSMIRYLCAVNMCTCFVSVVQNIFALNHYTVLIVKHASKLTKEGIFQHLDAWSEYGLLVEVRNSAVPRKHMDDQGLICFVDKSYNKECQSSLVQDRCFQVALVIIVKEFTKCQYEAPFCRGRGGRGDKIFKLARLHSERQYNNIERIQ